MGPVSQQIRFCTTPDGARIPYEVTGSGPALVRAPHWLTHLEYDWTTPARRHWLDELSRSFRLIRFDPRGCGLSDWDTAEISFDAWVRDLEAVVDAVGLEKFALLGPSQGAAIAVEYAARHPDRVTHLVLLGAFARGKLKRDPTREQIEDAETQLKLVELGWANEDPAYRQVFATQMMPGGSLAVLRSLSEVMRASASPRNAVRLIRMFYSIDVRESAARVRCPTLVLHARGDGRVPFEEGRLVAGLIPGARFVPLDSINHMLPEDDPAWARFLAELRAFVRPGAPAGGGQPFAGLSEREAEVLEQLAQGLDNSQIARRLGLSEKTVRNHLTHVFDKMRVEHRGQAIVQAREAGFGGGRPR